jgi:hypothetical protein
MLGISIISGQDNLVVGKTKTNHISDQELAKRDFMDGADTGTPHLVPKRVHTFSFCQISAIPKRA